MGDLQTLFVLLFGCLNNGIVILLFTIFGQPTPVQNLLPVLIRVDWISSRDGSQRTEQVIVYRSLYE